MGLRVEELRTGVGGEAEGGTPGRWTKYRTAVLTATLLALIAIGLAPVQFDPEAPGLGANTTTIRDARVAGVPVRDNGRPVLDVLNALPTRANGQQPVVWIGNSHQHAVNS